MKKIILTLICMLAFATSHAANPVRRHGQLRVDGTQLIDSHHRPVQLLGVSLGWHNFWPRFYNPGAVRWLAKDWKATVIRAAMGAKIEKGYLDNPQFALSCIEPVVEEAIRQGIYVIIDWHSHDLLTEQAKEFFSQMAQKYGKYPNVIYELYNEPVNDSWHDLKTYHKTIIDEIRRHDPDNIILCGCPHWDQDIDQVAANPIEGVENVMYTVHFYAATHKDYLREKTQEAINSGLPVFISECAGMEASGDGPLNPTEWQNWLDLINRNRLSYICWSVSDKDETCSMLLPQAAPDGKWRAEVMKTWGRMVRETLRKTRR
ncbi:MAG: glycoside hydrolase family 5 protein [Prevotella sp.]|nr:glycoside hydrolase family 5 protein [Prevotella sp.]